MAAKLAGKPQERYGHSRDAVDREIKRLQDAFDAAEVKGAAQ